jgi:tetratricopeptide (TPR) repeat protein
VTTQNNTMKIKSSLLAILLFDTVLVGGTSLVHLGSAVAADEKHTVTKELAKPLKAAQEAIATKKFSEAVAKLKEADASPKKTPWDQHVINELAAYAYSRTGNGIEAEKANEALINDGFTPQAQIPARIKAVAAAAFQAKNYDKALEYGNRAIKGGFADDEIRTVVGQSYYLKGDYKSTAKFLQPIIDAEIKSGKAPKDTELQLVLSSCEKTDDTDCTTRSLERLVTYYPKPDYWKGLLYGLRQDHNMQSDRNSLELFRLMSEVDVLQRAENYTEMAQIALDQGSPGEAQGILEKGFQKNVFSDKRSNDKNTRLLEAAKKAGVTDKAQLPKMDQDANAAPTGDKAVGVGLAYLGYGQYDKAIELLSKGLKKGGLKSEPEAHLLLGIAQLKGGHKDDAVKSFHQVKSDPALERIANLWSLHAKQA